MARFLSLRRSTLVVALALLGLAVPVSAAQADDFKVRGTFALQSSQGSNIVVAEAGQAWPGGKFSGLFVGHESPGNHKVHGVNVWDFGGGDTLTMYKAFAFDDTTGLYAGVYVITGGTGKFEGASGEGLFLAVPGENSTGTIELAGTISY